MKPHLEMKIDFARWEAFLSGDPVAVQRRHLDFLWSLVSKPIKFPAPDRRRREDREIPKAA